MARHRAPPPPLRYWAGRVAFSTAVIAGSVIVGGGIGWGLGWLTATPLQPSSDWVNSPMSSHATTP